MLVHLDRNLEFYGPEQGLRLFRKYAAQYLTPYRLTKEMRQKLLTREEPEEFLTLLDEITAIADPSSSTRPQTVNR